VNAARAISAAFTTYFDLVNLAEEHQRVQQLRERESMLAPQPVNESVGEAIASLQNEGVTSEQLQTLLDQLSIELVLTAHPTEARRRTVTSKIQRVAGLLIDIAGHRHTPRERAKIRSAIHAEVASLWLTDRHRTVRPPVTDEVRTGLYFVENVFWDALPLLYEDLEDALTTYYPDVTPTPTWLRLASWMGGDRDGNPNVTRAITAETLRLHRGLAVEKHRRNLQELARRLSVSSRRLQPSQELLAWIDARRPLPPHVAYIEERYPSEPYRLVLALLANDLAEASRDDMTARLLERTPHQARVQLEELLKPLEMITACLPPSLQEDEIEKVCRQLMIFGLHAMRLDLREDSSRLNGTLDETLRAFDVTSRFADLPEQERLTLLTDLLSSKLPDLSEQPGITPTTAETWALFQLIRRVQEVYGAELLGQHVLALFLADLGLRLLLC